MREDGWDDGRADSCSLSSVSDSEEYSRGELDPD